MHVVDGKDVSAYFWKFSQIIIHDFYSLRLALGKEILFVEEFTRFFCHSY